MSIETLVDFAVEDPLRTLVQLPATVLLFGILSGLQHGYRHMMRE